MGAFLSQFFVNPLFLIGVVSAGIPIVIHLIHRRKAPKVLFSTLRFLHISNERTARRQHLQDLLLLILRALICALIALALAKPFLPAAGWAGGPSAVALVLDNSMSMAAEDEGEQVFSSAKEIALSSLRQISNSGQVVLVLTNPPAEQAEPTPTTDLSAIERQILSAGVSAGKGNLPAAIRKAGEILGAIGEPNKQIHVITDLQKSSWTSDRPATGENLEDIPVIVYDTGSQNTANAAVADVTLRARSHVEGEPITIEGRLINNGPRAVEQTATLYIDGKARDRRHVTLAPNVPSVVSFSYIFTEPGLHTGRISLEDDRLKTDNIRCFSIRIQQQLKVLVVREEKASIDFLDDIFYLVKALNPLGDDGGSRSPILPVPVTTDAAANERFADYSAIYLVNLRRITENFQQLLTQYIGDGGGVVIFPGDNYDANNYNETLADPVNGLLPVQFGEATGNAENHTEYRKITSVDYTHPLLARFKGEQIFDDIRVYQAVSAQVTGRAGQTLLELADGSPLLIEKGGEGGKTLLFTTSAGSDWSNFPLKQAFLPLLHEITYYLARSDSARENYLVDSQIRLDFPEELQKIPVEVTLPSGRVAAVQSTPSEAGNTAVFQLTDLPGIYRWQAEKSQRNAGAFALNADTRESDLRQADPELVKRAAGTVYVVSSREELQKTVQRLREGVPLIDYFFLLVLAIAVFECFFSNWLTPESPPEVKKNPLGFVTGTQK